MGIDLRNDDFDSTAAFNLFKYTALNFSALASIVDAASGDFAFVFNSQGTKWLPGTIGGSYYPSGFYVFNGVSWQMDDTIKQIAEQLDIDIDDIIDLQNTRLESVVAGANVTVDNTDPLNPIISSSGGGTVANDSIILTATTAQDLNATVGLRVNFSTVLKNTIAGSSVGVSGLVNLPAGNYKVSCKIFIRRFSGNVKNIKCVIRQGGVSLERTAFLVAPGANAYPYASNVCIPIEINLLTASNVDVLGFRVGSFGNTLTEINNCVFIIEKI